MPRIRRSRRFRGRAAGEDDEECPVCRETYDDQSGIRRMLPAVCPRGHTMCESCWQNPLMETRCPICRAQVTPPNVSRRRERTIDDIQRDAVDLQRHPDWRTDDMTVRRERQPRQVTYGSELRSRYRPPWHYPLYMLRYVLVSLESLRRSYPEMLNNVRSEERNIGEHHVPLMLAYVRELLEYVDDDDFDRRDFLIEQILRVGNNIRNYLVFNVPRSRRPLQPLLAGLQYSHYLHDFEDYFILFEQNSHLR